jgi:uncharacterized protein (TIGR03067 family)
MTMSTDLDQLQGRWTMTSLEADGQAMSVNPDDGFEIVIKGDRFTSIGMGAVYEGTIAVDTTRKPKTLDMLFTAGHATGTRNLGIYKLDADRWTICLATRGNIRPTRFASGVGTGIALETLERAATNGVRKSLRPAAGKAAQRATGAPALGAAPSIIGSGPPSAIEGEWTMLSGILDGKPLAASLVQWCKRITRGDMTAVIAGPQTMLKARFTLDTSTRPNRIEYHQLLEGTGKGKSQSGIFELTGGVLRVCMAAPGKARPPEFSSKPGDGRSFTTWRLSTG